MKKQILLLIATAVIFSGCSDRKTESSPTSWFDQCLSGAPPYPIAGVSNKKLRSYEVVNKNDDLLTVRCTFVDDSGGDVVQTKILRIGEKGKLANTDSSDLKQAISDNLLTLFARSEAEIILEASRKGSQEPVERIARLSAEDLINSGKVKSEDLPSYIGEDYRKAKFISEPPRGMSLLAPDGDTYYFYE